MFVFFLVIIESSSPGSHMAAKVKMLSPKTDLDFVRGEMAPDGQRFPQHALGRAMVIC